MFTSTKEQGKGINMQSIEHLDNCQIRYFISAPDCGFVTDGLKAYVQGKMTAKPDDVAGDGDGFVSTKL